MAKIGDTVRFLNTVGGGKITKIEGKIVYVEENGFETPVLLKDVVVVLPSGHEPVVKGASIMFDQKAYDAGKKTEAAPKPVEIPSEETQPIKAVETPYGDKLNITLAFEPTNIKSLSNSSFNAVLVNDSNYWINFVFLRRSADDHGWNYVYGGEVAPNELIDLVSLKHEDLPDYEKICLQLLAFKKEKVYTLQTPVSVSKKLDLTKFHKFHCFRQGVYFDNPVIEISLVKDGIVSRPLDVDTVALEEGMQKGKPGDDILKQLKGKYNSDKGKVKKSSDPASNPHKLLPLIEVDLHIGELTDNTSGMEPKDMLEMQLSTVRKYMNANSRRVGQKLVFIHGKGEGVLRKAVLELLKKEYPKAELQDASFREYGFGATLVTIH